MWLILVVLLCGARLTYRFAKGAARRARAGTHRAAPMPAVPVLLYGAGPLAALYVGAVRATPGTGLRVVGIIEDAGTPRGRCVHDVPVLGGPQDVDRIVAELAVQGIHPERLVLTRAAARLRPAARACAERCRTRHGLELHFLPDLLGLPAGARDDAALPEATERAYFRLRRPVEVVLAVLCLLALLPVLGLIALLVLADQGPPVLFRQVRPCRGNRPFTLYKFRTMRVGASDAPLRRLIASELAGEDASTEGSWKLAGDTRVTRVGAVLRRTSIDELPQLLNVLNGTMTLVGPRPCLDWEADLFPEPYGERFAVHPGLTGLWQVSGRSTLGTLDMLELDLRYVRTRSVRGDLAILARTLPALLGGGGAR
jgi:lipopolysaccharide/colanic/teichoic acid biosynthesis glycosyltransferase